ncbi:glycine cleavage H-protein-domain-containing protein [Stachybotrys elegans]|uniref:Glycine cleavage system H protein n=1 Tax=Stachybotrys elegans TaxID=80388 RepID=A0A8K0SQX8_9HYPO|nr:glycine cleavage H-protein-domain-containing protein [Stachybotrys elegans]
MASIARTLRVAAPAAMRMAPRPAAPAFASPFRSFSTTRLALARKYTKDHEWIDISADRKTGVVGISEYAAEALGDVVYVELPESGDFIEKGDTMGAVESVKSASDINAPIRLRIASVNRLLEEKPATINQVPEDDSHGGGWIAKVELDDKGAEQFDGLMDLEAYKEYTAGEDTAGEH